MRSQGPPDGRIAGTEQYKASQSKYAGQMRRTAVISDKNGTGLQFLQESQVICRPNSRRGGFEAGDVVIAESLKLGFAENHFDGSSTQTFNQFYKARDRPALGPPAAAGVDQD